MCQKTLPFLNSEHNYLCTYRYRLTGTNRLRSKGDTTVLATVISAAKALTTPGEENTSGKKLWFWHVILTAKCHKFSRVCCHAKMQNQTKHWNLEKLHNFRHLSVTGMACRKHISLFSIQKNSGF